MANEKKVNPELEMVEIMIEKDSGDGDPNCLIGINGKNWLMPKGQIAKVPKYVADEYQRSREAKYAMDKTIDTLQGIKAKE